VLGPRVSSSNRNPSADSMAVSTSAPVLLFGI
jgi:hypothetical protein